MRMLEVQAAMDVYLMQMRRIDEAASDFKDSWRCKTLSDRKEYPPKECRTYVCGHYPPLDIVGTLTPRRRAAAKKSPNPQPPFVVSRPQLLQHMFRPGSPLDRFDHPVLFLHSGVTFLKMESLGRSGTHRADNRRNYAGKEGHEDPSYGENVDVALPATAAIPSLLGLARSVLSFAPQLITLALSGILERAVCGHRPPPPLPALRALSLGPPPPFWISRMRLDHQALLPITKLRLAGMILVKEELYALACDLTQIRELHWSVSAKMEDRLRRG